MKKYIYIYSALLLLSGLCFLSACSEDRDSNPVIQQPDTFVLNEPSYHNLLVDLAKSSALRFTCQQPDYGYPAVVNYQLQVSLTGDFTTSYSEAVADETGETVNDYATVGENYTNTTIEATPRLFAKAVMQCGRWEEGTLPEEVTAYVRAVATVDNYSVNSNVVQLRVSPFYMELQAAPNSWFLIGEAVNGWTLGNIGGIIVPLSVKAGESYDSETGYGIFEHTGYFNAGLMKIIEDPNAWAPMFGVDSQVEMDEEKTYDGTPTLRQTEGDDDPQCWNINVPGYYTFIFDNTAGLSSANVKFAYAKDQTPQTYASITLSVSGSATALEENSVIPHIWYADVDVADDGEAEFQGADGSVWSSKQFPIAIGETSGDKIPVKAGSYRVVFNDISKCYHFYAN